jgi:hypothetical protein
LRLFQLTPSLIEEAPELVALAFITAVFIALEFIMAAFIVVQPCAAEWRWASELLRSVLLPPELTELIAAETIPIDLATRTVAGRQCASVPSSRS